MEALNLASVWKLPLIFVCKDDNWSITTESRQMTGGNLAERVHGFDLPYLETDGRDVRLVWQAAQRAIQSARAGHGPTFLHAHCVHLEAHFLGYQLLRLARNPLKEIPKVSSAMTGAFLQPGGGSLPERLVGVKTVVDSLLATLRDPRRKAENDPLVYTRSLLISERIHLQEIEAQVARQIDRVLATALEQASV